MISKPSRAYTAEELEAAIALRQHDLLDRMVDAVEKVRDRLRRVSQQLQEHHVPYAIIGGNAVAAWVATVDPSAVRNTQDVDILLRREDLPRAIEALRAGGFVHQQVAGVDMFLDGPDALPSQAVHIIWAGEKVRETSLAPAPNVDQVRTIDNLDVIQLDSLLCMKLTSYRRKDQVHMLDLLGVGLIDESWVKKMPAPLAQRLAELLADPDG